MNVQSFRLFMLSMFYKHRRIETPQVTHQQVLSDFESNFRLFNIPEVDLQDVKSKANYKHEKLMQRIFSLDLALQKSFVARLETLLVNISGNISLEELKLSADEQKKYFQALCDEVAYFVLKYPSFIESNKAFFKVFFEVMLLRAALNDNSADVDSVMSGLKSLIPIAQPDFALLYKLTYMELFKKYLNPQELLDTNGIDLIDWIQAVTCQESDENIPQLGLKLLEQASAMPEGMTIERILKRKQIIKAVNWLSQTASARIYALINIKKKRELFLSSQWFELTYHEKSRAVFQYTDLTVVEKVYLAHFILNKLDLDKITAEQLEQLLKDFSKLYKKNDFLSAIIQVTNSYQSLFIDEFHESDNDIRQVELFKYIDDIVNAREQENTENLDYWRDRYKIVCEECLSIEDEIKTKDITTMRVKKLVFILDEQKKLKDIIRVHLKQTEQDNSIFQIAKRIADGECLFSCVPLVSFKKVDKPVIFLKPSQDLSDDILNSKLCLSEQGQVYAKSEFQKWHRVYQTDPVTREPCVLAGPLDDKYDKIFLRQIVNYKRLIQTGLYKVISRQWFEYQKIDCLLSLHPELFEPKWLVFIEQIDFAKMTIETIMLINEFFEKYSYIPLDYILLGKFARHLPQYNRAAEHFIDSPEAKMLEVIADLCKERLEFTPAIEPSMPIATTVSSPIRLSVTDVVPDSPTPTCSIFTRRTSKVGPI